MRRNYVISMVVLGALAFVPACGDDKGDTSDSAATTTQGTTTNPGTTSGATDQATGEPTTAGSMTATSDATGAPTTGATTGGSDFQYCQESCQKDGDCTIMGMDAGYTCQAGVCSSGQSFTCQSNDECDALFSGWVTPCASQNDCPGQVCIAVEGMGLCATAPGNGLTCDVLLMEEVMATTIEGAPATVCGKTGTMCDDGVCRDPCKADAECFPDSGYPHCNVGTGICECQSDDDCAKVGNPASSKCNAGVCGCGADADCMGGANIDKCYDGFCGCSSDAVCTQKLFDGTMIGCG